MREYSHDGEGGEKKISVTRSVLRVTRFPHFSLLLLASPILASLAALLLSRCHIERRRATAVSADAASQSHRPNASPGFRRRCLQDHVAFLVSCHALQTDRPRCLACTMNNLLVLLHMRAASAATSQRSALTRSTEHMACDCLCLNLLSQPPSRAR